MVAREIVWSVSKDALTITPNAPQRGAVQGEHNVTKVVFNIPDDCVLLGDDLKLYIGCTDSTGGYDKTDPLNVSNGRVELLLPRAWTQYGGTDVLELTAEKADRIVYSVKARVVFESRPGTKKGEKKLLEGFMQAACDAAAESAERAAASEQAAAGHAGVTAQNKSLTEQAARFAEAHAASAADASEEAAAAANHASNFARQAQQFSENAADAQNAAETSATRAEAAAAVAEQHAETVSAGVSAATKAANSAATDAAKAKASEEAADNARQAAEEMAEDAAGDAASAKASADAAETAQQAAEAAAEIAADDAFEAYTQRTFAQSFSKAASASATKAAEYAESAKEQVVRLRTLADADATKQCYITADGEARSTDQWQSYLFDIADTGALSVSAALYTNSSTFYAISFYDAYEIEPTHFLGGVLFTTGAEQNVFTDEAVPEGTVLLVISSRRGTATDETGEVKISATAALGKAIDKLQEDMRKNGGVPAASEENAGMFACSNGSNWDAVAGVLLPLPTKKDEGMVAKVVNGAVVWKRDMDSTPIVDTALDVTSGNPVSNAAVAQEAAQIRAVLETLSSGGLVLKEEFLAAQIRTWLDEHPEATTTVQKRSLTADKMAVGAMEYVTPQMFGAYGDGEHDDTAAIQAAMDAHLNVYIPGGTYLVNGWYETFSKSDTGGIKLRSGQRVYMAYDCIIQVKTNNGAFYHTFNVCDCYNVEIHGGHIVGERDTHDPSTHPDAPDRTQGFGIAVQNSDNVLIENVDISNMWGDAILLHTPDELSGYNSNITIRDCNLHDCERQGISVVVGDNVLISDCEIYNVSGHDPQSAIDLEPNGKVGKDGEYMDMFLKDITIENCWFHDCGASLYFSKVRGLTVNNCRMDDEVSPVQMATDVKINNCRMYHVTVSNDVEVEFNNCDIVGVRQTKSDDFEGTMPQSTFNNCRFVDGDLFYGRVYADILYVSFGTAQFNNCTFTLKPAGAGASQIIENGSSGCVFNVCRFALADIGTVPDAWVGYNIDDAEFHGCTFDWPETTGQGLFTVPERLVMQGCVVHADCYVISYSVARDTTYVRLIGNTFHAGHYVLLISGGVANPDIVMVNNVRTNPVYDTGFYGNWSDVPAEITDINNVKI